MNTLLKDFADAFDAKLPELRILMTCDAVFFDEWTSKDTKEQIILHQKAVDRLEDLYSNQADKISVPITGIANILNISVTQILDIIRSDKSKTFNRMITKAENVEDTMIRFKVVPYLLNLIKKTSIIDTRQAASSDAGAVTNTTISAFEKTKPSAVKKRKSKYAATKTFINEYQSQTGDIKSIRMFFLASGKFKTDEIALMSDTEIQKLFSEKYILMGDDTQTFIICKDACINILDYIYIIPNK